MNISQAAIDLTLMSLLNSGCRLASGASADREDEMNLEFTPEEEAFREEVRSFIAHNYPPELRDLQNSGELIARRAHFAWHKILAKKGWAAPSWPIEYGRTGWTPTQRYIWAEEQARAAA